MCPAPRRSGSGAKDVLAWLERRGTKKNVAMLARYGITARDPLGVTVGDLRKYAKGLDPDHALAAALWATGRYEAQLLAAFVDDPSQVTTRQMNAWAADFDNWAVTDTVCFALFDRSPLAWKRIPVWAKSKHEFTKRGAFALLWSLSVHDRKAADAAFVRCLPLVEQAATDERDLVKKGVDMALRAVGKRNAVLHTAAVATARRLAATEGGSSRWIGRHALRELESATVKRRLAKSRRD
ncbi:MAG: DNA alkylation repair protein [bacterium]